MCNTKQRTRRIVARGPLQRFIVLRRCPMTSKNIRSCAPKRATARVLPTKTKAANRTPSIVQDFHRRVDGREQDRKRDRCAEIGKRELRAILRGKEEIDRGISPFADL